MVAADLSRPLILVTNDDGVESAGLHQLAAALDPLGTVVVVAPASEMSGVSHKLTIWREFRVRRAHFPDGRFVYAVEGSPADCVKVATIALLDRRPDIVVSGVNRGLNVGENLFYSGTVGGAMEGAVLGIPAAAISLDFAGAPDHYADAAAVAARVAGRLLAGDVPVGSIANVNVPPKRLADLGPFELTRPAEQIWNESYSRHPDPADPEHGIFFRLEGDMRTGPFDDDTDMAALARGSVSVNVLRARFRGEPIDYDHDPFITALNA